MPDIWLRFTNGINNTLNTKRDDGPFHFSFADDASGTDVEVVIDASGELITSKARVSVSQELFQAFEDYKINELSEELKTEIAEKCPPIAACSRSVLRLLQQEIGDPELLPLQELVSAPSGHGNQWSSDGSTWRDIHSEGELRIAMSVQVVGELDRRWQKKIQELLDEGEKPLLAMQHLWEARRSSGGRFQWIEATIAAELAVKEILARMEPKLRPLLMEVPSPPLRKLYGPVLEAVAGERSPYVSELNKGVERRNRVIHRPEDEELDEQEVIDYLNVVSAAIRHLLNLHRTRRSSLHPPSHR